MDSYTEDRESSAVFLSEPRRDAVWIAAVNLLFAFLLISQVIAPLKSLTGDEPHYLVVTHSIVEDGDLNLRDDYNDGVWRNFFVGENLPPHYAPGKGGHYSTRIIGLSVYLVPFYWLGTIAGDIVFWARAGIALLYVLLMANSYLLCRDFGIPRLPSLLAWFLASFSVPLAFYSYSLYPETAAALLTVLSFRLILRWDGKSRFKPLMAGFFLAIAPWLGIKYSLIVLLALIVFLLIILKKRAGSFWQPAGLLVAVPVLFLALMALYLYFLYGTLSPAAIYTGIGEHAKDLAAVNQQAFPADHNPIANYLRLGLMYLVDQRDGLLFYSPVYIFGIVGLLLLLRERKEAWFMPAVFLLFWLSYVLSGWGSGHAPACRPFVAVLWVLVAGLAAAFHKIRGNIEMAIKTPASAVTLAFFAVFLLNNFLLYHEIYAHTAEQGNNFLASIPGAVDLTMFFPNLVNVADIHWIPTVIAVAVVVTLILVLYRLGTSPRPGELKATKPAILALGTGIPLLLFALAYWGGVFIPDEKTQGDARDLRIYFEDGNTFGYEPVPTKLLSWIVDSREDQQAPGFWVRGGTTARLDVITRERPESLELGLHSMAVPQILLLEVEGKVTQIHLASAKWKHVTIPGELGISWKRKTLFRITINCPAGMRPSESGGEDDRYLGCRVAVSAIHSSP